MGWGAAKEHWKNLNCLIALLEKGEKEANKKYDQLQCIVCTKPVVKTTQERLLNEMEELWVTFVFA